MYKGHRFNTFEKPWLLLIVSNERFAFRLPLIHQWQPRALVLNGTKCGLIFPVGEEPAMTYVLYFCWFWGYAAIAGIFRFSWARAACGACPEDRVASSDLIPEHLAQPVPAHRAGFFRDRYLPRACS